MRNKKQIIWTESPLPKLLAGKVTRYFGGSFDFKCLRFEGLYRSLRFHYRSTFPTNSSATRSTKCAYLTKLLRGVESCAEQTFYTMGQKAILNEHSLRIRMLLSAVKSAHVKIETVGVSISPKDFSITALVNYYEKRQVAFTYFSFIRRVKLRKTQKGVTLVLGDGLDKVVLASIISSDGYNPTRNRWIVRRAYQFYSKSINKHKGT